MIVAALLLVSFTSVLFVVYFMIEITALRLEINGLIEELKKEIKREKMDELV
jgi:cell division protein FtsL